MERKNLNTALEASKSIPKDENMFVAFNRHVVEELNKRISLRKCDKCSIGVPEGEGKFWHSGWFLCESCFKRFEGKDKKIRENVDTVIVKKQKSIGDY